MSNRSYVYALDESPKRLSGLSEWDYSIPLSHLLLVSGSPRLGKSHIWETDLPIAITGDYEEGVKRLLAFLDLLLAGNMKDNARFEKMVKETHDFLLDDRNRKQMIVLEMGEILDMQENPLEEEAKFLLSEIKDLAAEVDRLIAMQETDLFESSNNHHIKDLEANPEDLGLYWSGELYFNFDEWKGN